MTSSRKKTRQYRRLPGLRWSGGWSVLRLAEDHVLLCDYRTGFVERYRRFYFRDIEAVIVRKTMHWIAALAIWGFIALCFFLIGSATHWNTFLYVVEGICAFLILRNLIRGPTCRTHIQTAVQIDRLPMLRRVWKTRRVLRFLFPLIEAVQGKHQELPAGGVSIGRSPASPDVFHDRAKDAISVSTEEAATIPRDLSWFHVVAFGLTILSGLLALWEVVYPSEGSFLTLIILFCLSTIAGAVALVRQVRRRLHGGAVAMIWVLIISYVAGGAWVNTGYSFVDQILRMQVRGTTGSPRPVPFREISPFQMRHMAGFDYILWAFGIFSVILGVVGLLFTLMPASPKKQPPPLPKEHL